MDSSKVEVKKEIKEENIEAFDVPIKNETKSNFKLKVKKERKDNLGLQIGLDQGLLESLDIIERLDLPVKNEVQEDFNPNKGQKISRANYFVHIKLRYSEKATTFLKIVQFFDIKYILNTNVKYDEGLFF